MKTASEWEESVSWQRLANCVPGATLSWADVWKERLAFIRAIQKDAKKKKGKKP